MAAHMLGLFQFHCGFLHLAGLVGDCAALRGRESVFSSGRDAGGTQRKRCRKSGALVLCLLLAAMPFGTRGAEEPVFDIDIPAMNAAEALNRLAEQTGSVMLFSYDLAHTRQANAIRGRYSLMEGLELLLRGTGLSGGLSQKRVVVIGVDSNMPKGKGEYVKKPGVLASIIALVSGVNTAEVRADQDRGPLTLEEIVVTAQKREERLIDTPQSVTVISSEALDRLAATQFRDFANTVPGLSFTTAGPGSTQISLRGVTAGVDISPTVGIYVDEVPYGSSLSHGSTSQLALDVGLFDLSRIEVLRGPQGTLYGASTMGGLIKYVTREPDPTQFDVDLQAGLSDTAYGGINFNGALVLNTPIAGDKAALRSSAFYSRDGGYIDNIALGDDEANLSDVYGGRVDLAVAPNDNFKIRLSAFLQNISRDGYGTADFAFTGEPVTGELDQNRLLAEPFDQQFRLLSGTIAYDFGPATLTSISSYQMADTNVATDVSAVFVFVLNEILGLGPYSAVGLGPGAELDKFAQEVRLSSNGDNSLQWLVGAFYTDENTEDTNEFVLRDANGDPSPDELFTFSLPSNHSEYAAFGDLTWHFSDQFDVTGGIRYARHRQSFTQIQTGIFGNTEGSSSDTDNVTTYLANARYHFSDRATGYLRYATGYRPGGPNIVGFDPVTGEPLAPPTFEADDLTSYEVGFKADSPDRRYGIDAAAYFIDWDNIQINVIRNNFGIVANAPGGADIQGAELTLNANLERLSASAAMAYQDAKMSKADPDLLARENERLPNVPEFMATLNADYEFSGTWRPTVGTTVRYVGDRTTSFDASIGAPQYEQPDYTTVDLRVAFLLKRTTLQLFARNVFDERGQLSAGLTNFGTARVGILQPRTIGVTVYTNF